MDLYGPMRDVARKYLKSIPHTKGVPTQGEVDDLTALLSKVRAEARAAAMTEAAAMVDSWNIGCLKQDLMLAEEIRKLGEVRG